MVRDVTIEGGMVGVQVALTVPGCPLRNEIDRRVTTALTDLEGVERATVDFTVMTDQEREELRRHLHGEPAATAGSRVAHGHAEGRAIPFADPASRTRVILVASGKGGVGKSSVTSNLAIALANRGRSVAVVDADVWGFSIPRMLGVDRPPVVIDEMLVPPEAHGVRCISMGFFAGEDQPVIWRGPMLHKALEQFLTDVFWDDPEFLVIDLPPGTGDVTISMAQYLPRSELYVVTTPQPAAQRVAQRVAFMARKVNHELKGLAGPEAEGAFGADLQRRSEAGVARPVRDGPPQEARPEDGAGGGEELAERLEVPLLGQVPFVVPLREGADAGRPVVAVDPGNEASQVFARIAERIDVELAPTKRFHPELKIV